MKNSQVAHIWAQQEKKSASGSNFSFQNESIYSWTTEIARFIQPDIVVMLKSYPSVTTQKHLGYVRRALTHIEYYEVDCRMRDLPNSWHAIAPIVYANKVTELIEAIEFLRTKRSNIQYYLEELSNSAKNILKFTKKYPYAVTDQSIATLKLETICELVKNESLDTYSNVITKLKYDFNIDLEAKLEKEKINNERKAEKEKIKLEAKKLLEIEDLIKWRNGETIYRHFATTALRVKNDTIETTRGAIVPLKDARLAYRALKAGKDISGFRIGEFTVKHIIDDNLVIGCHTIPLQEIEKLASVLGWYLSLVA